MNFFEKLLKMNHFRLLVNLGTLLIFINCTNPAPHFVDLPEDVQAISLLGDSLRSNANLPEALTTRIDSLIEVNASQGDIASATIWDARLSAYNGEYKKTIETLSENVKPEFTSQEIARFLRHRGHRYITLREFELAKTDFSTAASLMMESDDRVEEDGLPNAQNIPLSSLYTNVWYHFGLANYLTGDFEGAADLYENCYNASTNDDMRVAALYWQYMSLRKLGRDEDAGKLLDLVSADMNVIENDSYQKLLLVFKGEFEPEMLLSEDADALSNATVGYGIGFWHDINGRSDRANQIWQNVYDAGNWAAFGYIASEVELASLD